jgi:hypothetical protein
MPIIWSTIIFGVILIPIQLLFRDLTKSSIYLSLIILLFFSYGAYQSIFKDKFIPFFIDINLDHNFYKYSSLILATFVGIYLFKTKKSFKKLQKILNFTSFILVIYPIFLITMHYINSSNGNNISHEKMIKPSNQSGNKDSLPSVFHFVLDAYGRDDILKSHYNFENTLSENLESRGFYLAKSANSNYNQTILSLPSNLNMNYLDKFIDGRNPENIERESIIPYLLDNFVLDFLRKYQYQSYTFDGQIYEPVILKTVDSIVSTDVNKINLFQKELYKTTILSAFKGSYADKIQRKKDYDIQRNKILNTYTQIEKLSKLDSRKFIFGHILSPHQPFIFDKDGNAKYPEYQYNIWYTMEEGRDPDQYKIDYIEQLQFINKRTLSAIDTILKNTNGNAIIIVQGDHGPAAGLCCTHQIEGNDYCERMGIINAIYLPNQNYVNFTDNLSPVNNYRLIFNEYFNGEFELLENRSYFSTWSKPFVFYDVTDSLKNEN